MVRLLRQRGLAPVLSLSLVLLPAAQSGAADPSGNAAVAPSGAPTVSYDLSLTVGGGDGPPDDLRERLEKASRLRSLASDPPATRLGLRRRLDADLEAFRTLLRSEGFYGAAVEGQVSDTAQGPATSSQVAQVSVTVEPGRRYTVTATEVVYRDGAPPSAQRPDTLAPFGLRTGQPARAEAVLTAERDLVSHLRDNGHPFAEAVDRRVIVNHAGRAMAVRIEVAAGPPATFGRVRVQGLERTRRDYVESLVPWQAGAVYDAALVERLRTRLLATRLFTAVTVEPDGRPDASGRLPVLVTVEEAPPRSIGGGVRYSTDDGPGVRAFWEHRNLLGRAEHLRTNLDLSLQSQSAEAIFRKPRFLHPDQSLRLEAQVERTDRDAYQGESARLTAGLDRTLSETWRVGGGVSVEASSLDDHGETETSFLVGLPMEAVRDDSDDPLNPTEGSRLTLGLTPFGGTVDGESLGFAVVDVIGSVYWAPLEGDRLVLAGRARAASLLGAERELVPPNHRLYAGGGGSVRGFGHQMIGPLDADGDPLGGRSALEFGAEARIRVTESIGVVPFLDAGLVGENPTPDFETPIRWAAGLGARYYTDFGPVRLDIAVPLNKRDEDDWFQLYVSFGQAF